MKSNVFRGHLEREWTNLVVSSLKQKLQNVSVLGISPLVCFLKTSFQYHTGGIGPLADGCFSTG